MLLRLVRVVGSARLDRQRVAAPRASPLATVSVDRVARSTRFADAERAAVEAEAAACVLAEEEGALHVRVVGEANEAVASRDAGRGVVHDLGRLGGREQGREESLRGRVISSPVPTNAKPSQLTTSSASPTSLPRSPTKTLYSPSHRG